MINLFIQIQNLREMFNFHQHVAAKKFSKIALRAKTNLPLSRHTFNGILNRIRTWIRRKSFNQLLRKPQKVKKKHEIMKLQIVSLN